MTEATVVTFAPSLQEESTQDLALVSRASTAFAGESGGGARMTPPPTSLFAGLLSLLQRVLLLSFSVSTELFTCEVLQHGSLEKLIGVIRMTNISTVVEADVLGQYRGLPQLVLEML